MLMIWVRIKWTIFYVEGLRRQCIYVYLHYKICEKIKKDESFSNERVRGIRFKKNLPLNHFNFDY